MSGAVPDDTAIAEHADAALSDLLAHVPDAVVLVCVCSNGRMTVCSQANGPALVKIAHYILSLAADRGPSLFTAGTLRAAMTILEGGR